MSRLSSATAPGSRQRARPENSRPSKARIHWTVNDEKLQPCCREQTKYVLETFDGAGIYRMKDPDFTIIVISDID